MIAEGGEDVKAALSKSGDASVIEQIDDAARARSLRRNSDDGREFKLRVR
jgi:hypothetical protein